jgi:hypothetical protein
MCVARMILDLERRNSDPPKMSDFTPAVAHKSTVRSAMMME